MPIALVSNTSKATGGTTPAIDTTGATLLVVAAAWTTATIATPAISDSKGNVWWSLLRDQTNSQCSIAIWVALAPIVGAGHTFTFTGSTSSACVAAFSGADAIPLAAPFQHAGVASGTSLQPGSITPPAANSLLITALANRVNTTYAVNSGYTITNQHNFVAAGQVGVALAYLIETTPTAQNPTWSWVGAGVGGAVHMCVQPASAGGGGGSTETAYVFGG